MDRAQSIRDLKMNPTKPKEKKPLRKVSLKKQAKMEAEKDYSKLDEDFYLAHWLAHYHKCENCNGSLGHHPYNWMFHHLLEKRNYPQFRHEHTNIMLLCLQCHSKAETNIDFAPKVKERRLQVEKELIV